MRETEYKEIDGVRYACDMMPATKAHKTLIELTAMVGRPVIVAIAKGASGGDLGESEVDSLAEVGTALLFDRLTPDSSDQVIQNVLDGVRSEGVGNLSDRITFDQHFRGRIVHLYKVFAWAVEVNYRDFFAVASSSHLLQNLRQKAGLAALHLMQTPSSDDSSSSETP